MDIQVTIYGISWKNEIWYKANFVKQQRFCKVKDTDISDYSWNKEVGQGQCKIMHRLFYFYLALKCKGTVSPHTETANPTKFSDKNN